MSNFKIRTTKPAKGNKCYIRKASGGWSACITGYPKDKNCDVLSNCVGYAIGRFCEIYNEIKGTTGNKYNGLNTNAENFIEKAKKLGLKMGSTPKPGAIICWQKGATLSEKDGAGHVAIVEKVYADGSIYTSESGYGSAAFWNSKRNNSNGRWGIGGGYKLRGFIYNPAITDTPQPEPQPKPVGTLKKGDKVKIIASGNSRKDGRGITSYGIGYTRFVLEIDSKQKYPYKIGAKNGVVTGYYAKSALKKL